MPFDAQWQLLEEIKMIKDLISVTMEEINESARHSVESENDNTIIMYLQNNGDKSIKPKISDIRKWINQDLDD